MTKADQQRLDQLIDIANEEDTPLTEWEQEFVVSLDGRRTIEMSAKQEDVFDRLVKKHLRGDWDVY